MKKVFFIFLTAIFIQNIFAQNPSVKQNQPAQPTFNLLQYGARIEPDKRLIVVMAALESAGNENSLTQPGKNFRQMLQQDLHTSPELKQKIKSFVDQYKGRHPLATPAEINAPFVSLAYTLSPAPELADPARDLELPADLLEVIDFGTLVREFYKTSGIDAKLPEYTKLYQDEGSRMRNSAAEMISELLAYLHTRPELTITERTKKEVDKKKKTTEITTRDRARNFFIVPNLLAPAGTINFRNIGDDYYVVVPPETNLSASEARRAYLQFVTDPLVLKNAKDITPFRDGIKQLLDSRQQTGVTVSPDVFLAVSRSFVAAVEAKQTEYEKVQIATAAARRTIDAAQGVEAKRAVSAKLEKDKQSFADDTILKLAENYEQGAVLDFYFAEQLKGIEDSGFDIGGSFRDMILSLNPAKESSRLTQSAEARQRALATRAAASNRNLDLPKKLIEIDALIKAKNFEEANARLNTLLKENPNEPRIYYNLGRVASASADGTFDENLLSERLGRAAANYSNAIRSATKETDPALISLAHFSLGRILEFNDQKEAALREYEEAIILGKIEGGAYNEAVAAKDKLTKKQ